MGISRDTQQDIYELGCKGLSTREIGRQLGVSRDTVDRYRNLVPIATLTAASFEPELNEQIRKALKKGDRDATSLADELDVSPKRITQAIEAMKGKGAMIAEAHGAYTLTPSFAAEPGKAELQSVPMGEWSHVFGAIGDNHLCNKHSRLDVLNAAYDRFSSMDITTVYNTGNWIDGEARFNKTELVTAPGMDNQLDYMIDKYPVRDGIITHYVAGDDHEGWYQQREGIEIGRYLQHRAEEQGRHDLKYLGYGEADISLKHLSGFAMMRVVHPGGGSSYALSYTSQKRIESYQGGEKPHIELAGHYHKAGYFYPRGVHCVDTGCTEDQTMFMRKKKLSAHLGFWVIKIMQDEHGAVVRFAPEFFPFFDKSYYQRF